MRLLDELPEKTIYIYLREPKDMEPRTYRHWIDGTDLISFDVNVKETDLYIRARVDLHRKAQRLVHKYRYQLEGYIKKNPAFLTSLEPIPVPHYAPDIVKEMVQAGIDAGVGPMAAVAGAIAGRVGSELLTYSPEIIVENGGDIFLKIERKRTVGVFAGNSPLTGKLGMEIEAAKTPLGICTSSGTVGHSLSYGKADAVIVLSPSVSLADAAATAIGNRVITTDDIDSALEWGKSINNIKGIVIIKDDKIGAWGEVKLCETAI
jgi:ApbE superfamily uncharacterized protein (UPF0280 family)